MKRLEFNKSQRREIEDVLFKYFGFAGVRWWIHEERLINTEDYDAPDRFSIMLDCTESEYKNLSLALMSIKDVVHD